MPEARRAVVALVDGLGFELLLRRGGHTPFLRGLLPGARSVIAYFVPFTRALARSNREGYYASPEWARAYVETNRLIEQLNAHLAGILEAEGHTCALVPATHNFDPRSLRSNWSHRHAAYIAGLGGFGLHTLLITASGCCGRIGSLLTTAPLPPSPRPQREACLHRHDGSCRACVERCVSGALQTEAFDRQRCYALLLENQRRHERLGVADACGKCVCAVPCAHTDPVASRSR